MDLQILIAVVRRFRGIVVGGFALAVLLALTATFRLDTENRSVAFRAQEEWVSYARVFVTQEGFPYGEVDTSGEGNPAGLAANALIYAQLATSDPVQRLAFGAKGPGEGHIEAAPVSVGIAGQDALPLISIAGIGPSASAAKSLADRETRALIRYIAGRQATAGIAGKNRVVLTVVQEPLHAALTKGRPLTVPVLVFLTVLLASVGLAFTLENARGQKQAEATGIPVGDATA